MKQEDMNKEVANQVDASQEIEDADQGVKKSDIILVTIAGIIGFIIGVVCMIIKSSPGMISFGVTFLIISIMLFIMLSYNAIAKHKNNK